MSKDAKMDQPLKPDDTIYMKYVGIPHMSAFAHLPHLQEFINAFITQLSDKLMRGRQVYGDESFTKPLPQGLDEIMAELIDQAGWAWCQWVRLYRIKKRITETEMMLGRNEEKSAL